MIQRLFAIKRSFARIYHKICTWILKSTAKMMQVPYSLCYNSSKSPTFGIVLDAGPRAWYESMPESERVNRYQAGFVDVIHSDFHPTLSWGLTIPLGSIDFYPNQSPQPGCLDVIDKLVRSVSELKDEGFVVGFHQWLRYMLFCSHYRSHEYFFESLSNRKCTFVGVRCPSYHMFRNGECDCESGPDSCVAMGYDSDTPRNRAILKTSPPGKWFIKTSDFVKQTGTHCLFQYAISIHLGHLFPRNNGTVMLTIATKSQVTHEEVIPADNMLYPGLMFGKLMVRQDELKNVKRLSFSWSAICSNCSFQSINLDYVKISPILVSDKARSLSNKFCSNSRAIRTGLTVGLYRCHSFE